MSTSRRESHESFRIERNDDVLRAIIVRLATQWGLPDDFIHYLAERWLRDGRSPDETVYHAMNDPALRFQLEAVWIDEVLPVFQALGKRDDALAYLDEVRERFLNPFLNHRIADIARNHTQKKRRRIVPLLELATALAQGTGVWIKQTRLRAAATCL